MYRVSGVMGYKREAGKELFLIRWDGYTKDDDTWEPLENLDAGAKKLAAQAKQNAIKSRAAAAEKKRDAVGPERSARVKPQLARHSHQSAT